jgi:hypothetical protein
MLSCGLREGDENMCGKYVWKSILSKDLSKMITLGFCQPMDGRNEYQLVTECLIISICSHTTSLMFLIL